jgi:Beta-lactamase enzyme family
MRLPTAAAALFAALVLPAGAGAADRWKPDVKGAAAWAEGRAGAVTFAVRTEDRLRGRGLDVQRPAASVFKAMLLVTYLRRAYDRPLGAADRALLSPMIRSSDNAAASQVRNLMGNAAVVRLARRAGMTRFAIASIWGLSRITARDQTRFFLHIDRLVPRRHRAYALRLLRTIVPSQRWGIAQAIPAGWRLYFKGGWGSGTGAVDHQVGLLRRGEDRVSIAVMTVNNPSHAYGKATLEGVSRRLLRGLEPVATVGPSETAVQFSPTVGSPDED